MDSRVDLVARELTAQIFAPVLQPVRDALGPSADLVMPQLANAMLSGASAPFQQLVREALRDHDVQQ